jgi:hypothetical protein
LSALQLRAAKLQEEREPQKEPQKEPQDREKEEPLAALEETGEPSAEREEQQGELQEEQAQQSGDEEADDEETEEPSEVPPQNASLLEMMFDTSAQCFSYTGGTCHNSHCAPFRHAHCSYGKCICPNGCAGADGRCYYHQQNRLVAKNILLRNAKWHHIKMYFQRLSFFGQIKSTRASSFLNMGQDRFDIWEVPGSQHGQKEYFLASSKWRQYVVGMKATTGTAFSPFGAYSVNLHHKGHLFDLWGPTNVMLRICQTPSWGLQIGAHLGDTKTVWAYLHSGSKFVYGSVSSPGQGGEWLPDPPLPHGTFPPCYHHLHHYR